MKEPDRKARNVERLSSVFPIFAVQVSRVIERLEVEGFRPRIQDAWRSREDQRKAFESGHSEQLFGFHNIIGVDGRPESLAVDLLDDDAPLNPTKSYILKLAAAAEAEGLLTGIRFGVPRKLRTAINNAIATADWNANVKIGWDPLHIQPSELTISEARAGKRPK